MSELIQGFKLQCHINSIDFNSSCTYFATGGRDYIRIFGLNLKDKCWFKSQRTFGKYKGASITKACVSQLAWNKEGRDALAIGTTSGLVLVYDIQNQYKNIMQVKGHQGNIKNIEWNPGSRDRFISSSFENEIIEWDVREEKQVAKYQFHQNTKIRDVKFNPHRPEQLAVQSSTKLQLMDLRKGMGMQIVSTYEIYSNQMQGIGVQWDPINAHRIASAISKEISVFDISSNSFQLMQGLAHYSLIKSFYWMTTKPSYFGIMGEHPEKNLFFYDLQEKNRMAYMYGGHGRSIDCWRMDNKESILLSVSNQKEKAKTAGTANSYAFIVAQFTQNYVDPNESKFNYPVSFNNDSDVAFCLNLENSLSKKSSFELMKKKSTKSLQSPPSIYRFRDQVYWFQSDKDFSAPLSIKEEVIYLARNYMIQGNNEKISQNNSEVAAKIGKIQCAQMWKNLFQISFPPEEQEITLEAIYERKLKLDIAIVDNRVILSDKQQKMKIPNKIEISFVLQWLIDEYSQLQTAAMATVCLLSRAPELMSPQFVHRVLTPYIELLRSLQLYEIAAETVLMTKTKKYTQITEKETKYCVTCGSCKLSVSKDECKCNLLCVICQGRLSEKLVIWCKYCGHGGHAAEYEQWFKVDKKKYCPHGCGHTCFTTDD